MTAWASYRMESMPSAESIPSYHSNNLARAVEKKKKKRKNDGSIRD